MVRAEVLNRCRHLRAIGSRHHNAALDGVPLPALLERAKHLGLADGQTLCGSEEEMTLKCESWLVDEGLTATASTQPGLVFASRLCWPAEFAMTCGVVVPLDLEMLDDVLLDNPVWLRHSDIQGLSEDPRFAAALPSTPAPWTVLSSRRPKRRLEPRNGKAKSGLI